ncbi:hypothetical protein HPP92_016425 [Vanilla planifolia]|uniref:X8 domain-containing protein n=1 Tax=Vanilla planifolia TaxID=51239 RepID=A0A835UQG4_VANPL|nr:hypothetical protein HPP92_016425 [Vanilla planifolia]
MRNLRASLSRLSLDSNIKLSSPIALTALESSYPPSSASFRPDLAEPVIRPMLDLLRQTQSFLMVNAYPFFAYEANSAVISQDYALFRPNTGIIDAGSGLKYYSLFDAQIDAVYAAMSALKFDDIPVVVSETGWPSKGDAKEIGAGFANAAAYNGNLVRHVLTGNAGTPLRPKADIDVFLFALFNENLKPGPTSERNYGLFYPNEEKVYDIELSLNVGGGGWWNEERGRIDGRQWRKRGAVNEDHGEKWCVANAAAGKERLQAALDYACGPAGGADCKEIQPGRRAMNPTQWRRTRPLRSIAIIRRRVVPMVPATSPALLMSSQSRPVSSGEPISLFFDTFERLRLIYPFAGGRWNRESFLIGVFARHEVMGLVLFPIRTFWLGGVFHSRPQYLFLRFYPDVFSVLRFYPLGLHSCICKYPIQDGEMLATSGSLRMHGGRETVGNLERLGEFTRLSDLMLVMAQHASAKHSRYM